jgi:8-oxo-dGTP pyrophosphatase MutT (NUDIX family)
MENEKNIPEFGIKRENEERRDGGCAVVFDPETKLYAVSKDMEDGRLRLFAGGVDKNEDIKEGVLREVVEESGLCDFLYIEKIDEVLAHFYNNLKKVNRIAKTTCFLVILKSLKLRTTKLEQHEKFYLTWEKPEKILTNWDKYNEEKNYDHYIYFFHKSIKRIKELGYNIE